jgi:uncharacterized protein (DUF362 family)
MMSQTPISRRDLLKGAGAVAGVALLGPAAAMAAVKNPTSPVSIARCTTYDFATVMKQLETITDQVGGLKRIAAGKTVVVKANLTGTPSENAVGLPAMRTYQTHPTVLLALATLLDRAGAKRIRFVEGTYQLGPMENHVRSAGWDLQAFSALKAAVEYEDTRNLGKGKQYHRVKVPWGGSLYPAYDLNHSYVDCDSYISVAKLKNHMTAGVTLTTKNNFGVTPTALYSHHEPNERSTSARVNVFHTGEERPADGLPQEVNPNGPKRTSYRVPRHTVDSIGIRPIDLAIIDGIETVSGGEGPWHQLKYQKADVLLAGRNPICTDAVATAVMGYDPMAASATGPFPGDNHLALAAALGLGTNNPKEIEVRGLSIREALHPFNWEPSSRNY